MPINECAACGKMMSSQSKRCPHCGYEPPKPSLLGLKLLVVLLLATGGGTYVALRKSQQGRAALESLTDFFHSEVGVAPRAADAQLPIVADIAAIAGHAPKEVAVLLGAPYEKRTVTIRDKTYPANFYKNGQIQIVYVDGKADWITIFRLSALPYGQQSIKALNLPVSPPVVNTADVIKWQDVNGIKEISLYPEKSGKLDYASILVRTEP
ncbi:MAG: hypothetical protein M3081_12745 [Gemmatimonadota bacterium]|nr:hypothetical protein [Gemmatimonadota bacterium]